MNKLALYCRAGFEKEVAGEISDKATELGVYGFTKLKENSGYVIFECYQQGEADRLAQELPLSELIFVRQMIVVGDLLEDLPENDRISPILEQYLAQQNQGIDFKKSSDLVVETPDTNEAKELSKFCRKFTVPLRNTLKKQGWLHSGSKRQNSITLQVLFIGSGCCYVGYAYNDNRSSNPMGIMRLKFPIEAPSRSTLKLEEAILTFIPKSEESWHFNENVKAVDLGACPGGWTYQLVKRDVFVYCVDHGKMADSLHNTGRIDHCPEDGFKFKPPKRTTIDLLVCDMVEQPMRISELITKWFVNGWCKESIFNLKLPMKKRYQEVQRCLNFITETLTNKGFQFTIQAKHLYHDREEITVFIKVKKQFGSGEM
ncbi:23S rRNA (cytidine(2498)-2'-O)-methyltransferase RlmM [Pasteurella skyensis]|uniref:Ribosomal RNA large subunit methyltransferase M n=1 Tax=Phocoenobacter skyensis TaxID=97481 RepID=A0AAJ6P0Q7_9PAST|nr:23S rRNA (cytidine(2498)-2'-O)-methyltransferase RlmM [Pasteurella skyensis]MDP8162911.1 23S rRNA (cytidine(2498)-2'-O)-methyltransferase RlmM [Pasteurella skyensis]MDP8172937.1 23S rRNA (cytidine(2498)-2'-O)-methyltransferase RlmM [Pasteurella skyensis]MDP8176616.1 23S rRNA (cytidine(2498)-2'-O)-methyltransferase RlmM [Pasteurella skyensis]MDP8179437.1 23S rRNA (cytidine(2498)-2'-O)-methyltransferase RlmM [Pasteurella skyensis]MDP8183521.1 23S rRNA (cytidine(2498)-2'-O)-methyltransferase R